MKVVLDTQVWLDWFVFDDPGVALVADCAARGAIELLRDPACEAELERVLGYPLRKQKLSKPEREQHMKRFRSLTNKIVPQALPRLPVCDDPDDQKFLEAAGAGRADLLVTKDGDLLALARKKLPFRIAGPRSLLKVFLEHLDPAEVAEAHECLRMRYPFGTFLFRHAEAATFSRTIGRLADDCRALKRTQPAHAVVLLPDARRATLDVDRVWRFVRDAKAYLSVLDPRELCALVQEAHGLSAAAKHAPLAPLVAFDFCMLERFNRSVEKPS